MYHYIFVFWEWILRDVTVTNPFLSLDFLWKFHDDMGESDYFPHYSGKIRLYFRWKTYTNPPLYEQMYRK
jgi:hypothetical protein